MTAQSVLINPATGEEITRIRQSSSDDVDAAVERARRAQREWAARTPSDRARALRGLADIVDRHLEELASLEVENSGHPVSQARAEAAQVRDSLEYFAAGPERLLGKQIPVAGGIDVTFHEPLGIVGVITPWNFPMPIAAWAFAPALAAENAVLVKPADWTPLTTLRIGQLAAESDLPDGLLQVIPGRGSVVGDRLVTHPDVRKIVFTGSTEVGKQIMAGCAAQVKRVTLEPGGKSANIVFADADLERAAAAAPYAVFDNAGQDCCARSRILVEASAMDRFLELLEGAVSRVRVGDPTDERTEVGPLVHQDHLAHVRSFIDDDADVVFAGSAPTGPGNWFAPVVLRARSAQDRCVREEIFGPVVVVQPFSDEADALRLANDTEYGLSGSIWTRDLGRSLRVARGLDTGSLSINSNSSVRLHTPFGGMKQSGLGRELGPDAVHSFTEEKNVFIATD